MSETDHIADTRLAEIAEQDLLATESEFAHLRRCVECSQVLHVFRERALKKQSSDDPQ